MNRFERTWGDYYKNKKLMKNKIREFVAIIFGINLYKSITYKK